MNTENRVTGRGLSRQAAKPRTQATDMPESTTMNHFLGWVRKILIEIAWTFAIIVLVLRVVLLTAKEINSLTMITLVVVISQIVHEALSMTNDPNDREKRQTGREEA